MSNNVALLGGGFDPISLGHEHMAQLSYKHTGYPVWLMPCYQHLFGKELASPKYRLDMVNLIAEQYEWAMAIDFEIRRKSSGSMYDTLQALRAQNSDIVFHLIIGTDNANRIFEWDQAESLIAKTPFIVILRPDYQPELDWFMQKPHTYIKQELITSSTAIRQAIEGGRYEEAKKDLNPKVWDYIVKNEIYGYEAQHA